MTRCTNVRKNWRQRTVATRYGYPGWVPDSSSSSEILSLLAQEYPDAACALRHDNAFELLVATVLSAQTTDKRVNSVTPELFAEFPDAHALGQADPDQVQQIVRPLGFQARRAKQLVSLASDLVDKYGGEVPEDRESLQSLAGVGRKTAHVVMGNVFGEPAITVDTHVGRLTRRWGWSKASTPLAIERDIAQVIPRADWTVTCHRIIEHGRQVCHSRNPECGRCVLRPLCPSSTC